MTHLSRRPYSTTIDDFLQLYSDRFKDSATSGDIRLTRLITGWTMGCVK